MNQLLNLLSRRRLTLLVSLPQNSADMAKAAVAGAAEWRPNGTPLRSVPDYKRILG